MRSYLACPKGVAYTVSMLEIRMSCVFFLFLLICLFSPSLSRAQQKPGVHELPPDLSALLNDARLAAPELTVNTILTVLEKGRIRDQTLKKQLLDEAIRLSDNVKEPAQLWPIPVSDVSPNESAAFLRASAHAQKLDRLDFLSRVIKLMIDVDPLRARQIVQELSGNLKLKPRSCSDDMTYEVAGIYSAVGAVATHTFTEQEVADGRRAIFLQSWLEDLDSPAQIEPALQLAFSLSGPLIERQLLAGSITKGMTHDFHDDRTFTFTLGPVVRLLGARSRSVNGGEQDFVLQGILTGFRDSILKNLGSRCSGNEVADSTKLPLYIVAANRLFSERPIANDDIRTREIQKSGPFEESLGSASETRLREDLLSLRGKLVDGKPVSESSPEWKTRVNAFVDKLEKWSGDGKQSEFTVFVVRATTYDSLLGSVADPELKRYVARSFAIFLLRTPLQKTEFLVWHLYASRLLKTWPQVFAELIPNYPNANIFSMLEARQALQ